MKNWFLEMLSTSNASSCMRFCVVVVVLTIMFNYTFLNIIHAFSDGSIINMSVTDIVSLMGVLGLKLGQKKIEGVIGEVKNG